MKTTVYSYKALEALIKRLLFRKSEIKLKIIASDNVFEVLHD